MHIYIYTYICASSFTCLSILLWRIYHNSLEDHILSNLLQDGRSLLGSLDMFWAIMLHTFVGSRKYLEGSLLRVLHEAEGPFLSLL